MHASGLARKRAGNNKIGKYPGELEALEAKKDKGCEKPAQRTAKAAPDWRTADLEPRERGARPIRGQSMPDFSQARHQLVPNASPTIPFCYSSWAC